MKKGTTYFVNGIQQNTEAKKLLVSEILELAGFTPHGDYRLIRDEGNKELTDHSGEEPIHEGERFTAIFSGVTPVS